jgi:hypothetical protein
MSMERAGACALILGAIAYVALMAVHPSHGGGPNIIGTFSLSALVHATALISKPVLVFGFVALTRSQGFERPLPVLALCFYALAALFTMFAGTMSGVMFPKLAEAAHAPGADIAVIQDFARYTTWLNRSYAQVHFDLSSIAILIWSLSWRGAGMLAWGIRIVGAAVGLGVLGWQLSDTINLEARQGALLITLGHSAWAILAAFALLGRKA